MQTETHHSSPGLEQRLQEPAVLEALNRLVARIDALEEVVLTASTAIKEAPMALATVTDMADEVITQSRAAGIDLPERAGNALKLAEVATRNGNVEALTAALSLAEEAPGFMAMAADIIDEASRNAQRSGIDIDQRLQALLQLGLQLTDPASLTAASALQGALIKSMAEPAAPVGPMGAVSRMRDPQVKLALGFLLNLAKHLGQELQEHS